MHALNPLDDLDTPLWSILPNKLSLPPPSHPDARVRASSGAL